jgi:hypothetical protein
MLIQYIEAENEKIKQKNTREKVMVTKELVELLTHATLTPLMVKVAWWRTR